MDFLFFHFYNLVYRKGECFMNNVVTITSRFSLIRVLDDTQIAVNLTEPVQSLSFKLSFDESLFEFIPGSVVSILRTNLINTDTPGVIAYSGTANGGKGSKKVGFTFKAIKKSSTCTFKVTDLVIDNVPVSQSPMLDVNVLPFVIRGASSLPLVDDTKKDDTEDVL